MTPSFGSFTTTNNNITGVNTTITGGSGTTFVGFKTFKTTDSATTIATSGTSTLTTGIYSVSAAAISKGILGNISSYQFAICPAPTMGAVTLTAGGTVTFAYTQTDSTLNYSLVSNSTSPTTPASGLPSGAALLQTKTGGSDFVFVLTNTGTQSYYIVGSSTLNGVTYYGIGSALKTFTYSKDENILSTTAAGNTGTYTFTGGATAQTRLYVTLTSGKGGNGDYGGYWSSGGSGGYGYTFTVAGWTGLANNQIITIKPAGDGVEGNLYLPGGGGGGGVGFSVGGKSDTGYGGGYGGGGGGSLFFSVSSPDSFGVIIPGGGGGGGGGGGVYGQYWGGGGGAGAGASTEAGANGNGVVNGVNLGGGKGTFGGGSGGNGGWGTSGGVAIGGGNGSNASSVQLNGSVFNQTSNVATSGAGFSINVYWITT